MRSKAHFKSHPIHPMLIPFPIAFFTGAFVFDLLTLWVDPDLVKIGYYLAIAGVVTAVVAAVPGVIDYFFTVPPKSSAKKRATKHALLNTTNLLLFTGIIFFRSDNTSPGLGIVLLEMIGIAMMVVAGWMGGTLVYRNQIGVDILYAEAGKWSEVEIEDPQHEFVAEADDLQINQMKLIHYRNKRIVLCRTEQGFAAFDDYCTHRGASLAAGAMICGTVQCPWHGSQFDVYTGDVKAGPAEKKIHTYEIEQRDGKIYLKI